MSCLHRQAEPVILSTGEHVACVCIECLQPLPPNYIDKQRVEAEQVAHCTHEFRTSILSWGGELDVEVCMDCREKGQFFSIYDTATGERLGVPYWSLYEKALAAAGRYHGYGYQQIDLRRASA